MTYASPASHAGTSAAVSGDVSADAGSESTRTRAAPCSGSTPAVLPVATTTGAIRLEDQKAGAVWLQLPNKSMLMNQKLGMRLADDCMSPAQMKVAEAIKLNPPASVLDAPKPVAAAAAAPGVEQPASPSK